MSMALALHGAANNCARDGATATLTLKSGVQVTGKLSKPPGEGVFSNEEIAHVTTDHGWATVVIAEIAAVIAEKR